MTQHTQIRKGALAALCVLALGAVACCYAGGPPAQSQLHPLLNPQPEPPSLVLNFRMNPDGSDWFGTVYVGGEACGTIQLLQTEPKQTGIVTHVGYELSITGENPDFLLDAALEGVIVKGRVVLNGQVTTGYYAGRTIHPRGVIQFYGDGAPTDQLPTLTGAVQLNPQPEPPSDAYPPSPCLQ